MHIPGQYKRHTRKAALSIFISLIRFDLKVIYHPLDGMNNFVTNKSKLPQDGAQVFPYMG